MVNIDPGNFFLQKMELWQQVWSDDSKQVCWWTFREFSQWRGDWYDSYQYILSKFKKPISSWLGKS